VVILIYIPANSVKGPSILTGVRWNLGVAWICISFMSMDIQHFVMYLLPCELLPLKIVCSLHVTISSLDCWFFGSLVFWAPCKSWLLIPCQMYDWQIFFFHAVGCLFSLVTVSFAVQKLCSLMQSHLSDLSLVCWATGALFRKLSLMSICSYVSLFFPVVVSKGNKHFWMWRVEKVKSDLVLYESKA
jgi:hypothetical protein